MIKVFYDNVNKSLVFLSGEFFLRFHTLACESSEGFDLIFFNDFFFSFFNPFKTETVTKSMDWFLYDNGLRLERVKSFNHLFCFAS